MIDSLRKLLYFAAFVALCLAFGLYAGVGSNLEQTNDWITATNSPSSQGDKVNIVGYKTAGGLLAIGILFFAVLLIIELGELDLSTKILLMITLGTGVTTLGILAGYKNLVKESDQQIYSIFIYIIAGCLLGMVISVSLFINRYKQDKEMKPSPLFFIPAFLIAIGLIVSGGFLKTLSLPTNIDTTAWNWGINLTFVSGFFALCVALWVMVKWFREEKKWKEQSKDLL